MKKVSMVIDGNNVNAMMFVSFISAKKYASKKNLSIVFYRAHEYYVA